MAVTMKEDGCFREQIEKSETGMRKMLRSYQKAEGKAK